ncbi:uncharacterized protein LOC142814051 [Rhipicephalus microplus]|uniref:uncharacterized protein LOC142814051 n=1 Tax=Rhipicephalus microplus TaxID=6941 RepID=UPI003F6B8056
MDKAAQRRERKAAAARARRQNPDVQAREAEALREGARRRRQDPAVREKEAAAARRRHQDLAVREREAAAARRRRQDPAVREKEAAAARLRREQDLPNATQREAARKRAYRQANPEARVREASAKRAKKEHEGAGARFKRDFLDVSFGHSCGVYDRLWFSNSLVTISSIKNDQARGNAIAVLRRDFPADDGGSSSGGDYNVCSSCKNSLVAGKVPPMSVSYGYTYPPKPDHLPPLNPVEERLIAPRLPFMSIRRLTHGSGQYGIKGQVVNVLINVPNTVQCLPRNVPDDVAIDVHLKCRLVCKPSYKKGLVKKRNIHEWLKHLEHSPLYKYLKIKIDWSRLANVQDDGDVDDDEIEPAPEVTDLEEPMQAVIALNAMAHTMIFYDGACIITNCVNSGGDVVAESVAGKAAHSAADEIGLIEGTHSLHVAPGEGQTPISLLFDEYAKELSFPQIYLGIPRRITGHRPTPFTKASSEIRRTDRRGVCPDHVFYMAMKVMRHNVASKTMTFRTNAITSAITRQQLENAHFMDEVLNRDLGFMRGIPNTVQYWQDRRKELFAMIRQLDFFKRVEFQQRGSAHIHTILWLDNAPQEEVSGNMPRTLEMVESLLTLDTDLLKRPRT